ncbi:uncharacterized protein Dwil_GK18174 [Drosophila willistoni]|uniref:CUB domain-containing protein n=1 Tax=Drosophila willistoni TaxID=7260 RepID=B4MYT7_DROWI|nr:uncharacterized protein LOC6643551 [Drosophila willistoni]EDW77276.1 uncharacterized protein Dwil_GK18174 [Drosophila willistoni]
MNCTSLYVVYLVLCLYFCRFCHCQLQCNSGRAQRQKRIAIQSPSGVQLSGLDHCQYEVTPWSNQVCQVRIDFVRLELEQPQLNATSQMLECVDFLQVQQRFRICGKNNGQHLYVPLQRGQVLQLLFTLATRSPQSVWQLTLTQLECPDSMLPSSREMDPAVFAMPVQVSGLPSLQNLLPRTIFGGQSGIGSGNGPAAQLIQTLRSPSRNDLEMLAPLGCDQYWQTTTGKIVSFNFGSDNYVPNMKYSICIKGMANNEISYTIDHLSLSKTNNIDVAGVGYDADCQSLVSTVGHSSDYLLIPNSYMVNNAALRPTYYCGNGLTAEKLIARPPFVIYFSSDAQTSASETGFQLTYTVQQRQVEL